jgi:hypothetical protein
MNFDNLSLIFVLSARIFSISTVWVGHLGVLASDLKVTGLRLELFLESALGEKTLKASGMF